MALRRYFSKKSIVIIKVHLDMKDPGMPTHSVIQGSSPPA